MCPELLGEIREVLTTRPRLRKWISLENATVFVDTIEAVVDLVNDPDEVTTETRHPNDDYLIALARAHDVDVIVSGDKDLLEWEEQRPPVMTPTQFEDRGSTTQLRSVIRSIGANHPLVSAQVPHRIIPPQTRAYAESRSPLGHIVA